MTRWINRLHADPVPWLLEYGCAPIRYRTLTEIAGRSGTDAEVAAARDACAAYKPVEDVWQLQDRRTGMWLNKLLQYEPPIKSRHRGPGFVNQFLFLVERGWDPSDACFVDVTKTLLGLVQEEGSGDLWELKGYAGTNNVAAMQQVRRSMAEIAAACLVRAGFGDNPAVRAVTQRVVKDLARCSQFEGGERFDGVLEVPEDAVYRRLRVDWCTPDMFLFYMLAFHQDTCSAAAKSGGLAWLGKILGSIDPTPRRVREVCGKKFLKLKDLGLTVWTREEFADGRLGYLLHDLEMLARTGLLTKVPAALELLEWVLSLRKSPEDGFFDVATTVGRHKTRSQYHYFPLEEAWKGKHKKSTDVVFRVALILSQLDKSEGK